MKNLFFLLISFTYITGSYAQLGVKANNTVPIPSAQLEVQSTTKAFYPPRMNTTQRTTLPNPPEAGAMVFDTDLNRLFIFNGSSWVSSGLTLPFSGSSINNFGDAFSATNSNSSNTSAAIRGQTTSSTFGNAIAGFASDFNPTSETNGIYGSNSSNNANGSGVSGYHGGSGKGVNGYSQTGIGGYFTAFNGYALITGNGNVGMGIPDPLEKLHVSGNIRVSSLAGTSVRDVKADVNGNLITTPNSYTISIGPTAFSPRYNNSGTFTAFGPQSTCFMSVGSTDDLMTPISLPNGAKLTSVILYYIDTDATIKFRFILGQTAFLTNTFSTVALGSTTAISSTSSSILSFSLSILSPIIDNSNNSYVIIIRPENSTSNVPWAANMSIKGVKITYTL